VRGIEVPLNILRLAIQVGNECVTYIYICIYPLGFAWPYFKSLRLRILFIRRSFSFGVFFFPFYLALPGAAAYFRDAIKVEKA